MSDPSPFAQGDRAGLHLLADLEAGHVPVAEILATGIAPIDEFTHGGLRVGELSVIGASTGHGKTALAEQIALEVSKRHRTTFFALEMGRRRTETRMLTRLLRIDHDSVQSLMANHPDNDRLRSGVESLVYDRRLILEERDDTQRFTSRHLFVIANANAPKLIVLDHPRHLDDWRGSSTNRSDLASEAIVRNLLAWAKVAKAHVMVVAQTRRDMMGKRPTMQDLADTYALAQAADLVVMLHRPFRGQGVRDNVVELVLDKNRNGPEGIIHARWHGPRMSYSELSLAEELRLECCAKRKKKTESESDPEWQPYDDSPI